MENEQTPAKQTIDFMLRTEGKFDNVENMTNQVNTKLEVMKNKLDGVCEVLMEHTKKFEELGEKLDKTVNWTVFWSVIVLLAGIIAGVLSYEITKISAVEDKANQNTLTSAVLKSQNETIILILKEVQADLKSIK